ncbi:MAG: hypothetical protein M3077_09210 [Candidatus Dormibacteraeota bacterium]|nr:hypothetical protein [Candidatus Dormibacteraeota bacterium]
MSRARILGWVGLVAVAIAFIFMRGAIGGPRPYLDGYTPPPPYRWVSPPPNLAATNQAPTGGDTTIPLTDGASDAAGAFTDDGQITISFNPGTFKDTTGQTAVHVHIAPISPQPAAPQGIVIDGNVYLMQAAFVPSGKPARPLRSPVLLDMRYPSHKPDAIYRVDGKSWTPIESTVQELLQTVDARATELGTFAAAHQATGGTTNTGGVNPLVLLAVGLAVILAVALLAGVRIRRRR